MRKSFFITASLIAAALLSLVLLAFNQFQLYDRHEQIISQTEKLTFQYSNIREQIIDDIVQNRVQELSEIASGVEDLHNSIIKLLDNPLIPAEYKFSFMQQIDLPGLVLLLRRTATSPADNNLLRRINEDARIIGERFMLLERLVLGYAKQKLVDFQAVVIGILALVVFLVTTLLVVTYRLLILPVVSLVAQSENVRQGTQDRFFAPQGWREVTGLADRMNILLQDMTGGWEKIGRMERILNSSRVVAKKIREAEDELELSQAVCRALLLNSDNILAWIGIEEGEGEVIAPFAADGSSTMTGKECQECFGALLAAQEGKNDPVLLALQTGGTVIRQDILANAPKGPFKNTPMASGIVDSISCRIGRGDDTFGVLTVYVMARGEQLDLEAKALEELVRLVEERLRLFDLLKKLRLEKSLRSRVGEKADIITLVLNREGVVRTADTFYPASPYREACSKWLGRRVTDLLRPRHDSEKLLLENALAEGRRYEFTTELVGQGGEFSAILTPTDDFPADEASLFLVLIPPAKNLLIQPENFQMVYSSAIGQFASTIAHEITDLSNGIINYAQMLSDEMGGAGGEQRKQLARIIAGGEKVAAVVEPLLVEQHDAEYANEAVEVRQTVEEALILAGYQLRKDGISVQTSVQPQSLKYGKQYMRLVLLALVSSLRSILNREFSQKGAGKELTLSIDQLADTGKGFVRISVVVPWTGIGEADKAGCPADLWLCRELACSLGGEMKLTPVGQDNMKIELVLPA